MDADRPLSERQSLTPEAAVLAQFTPSGSYLQAAQIARLLSLEPNGAGGYRSVPYQGWCPVGPPRRGSVCASVPRQSAARVVRLLRRLVAAGRLEVVVMARGRRYYRLPAGAAV